MFSSFSERLLSNNGQYCKVYDRKDAFTAIVQLALALGALLSLYLKRLREVPRRTLRTWSLDIGKQGIGACYAHVLNMVRKERFSIASNDEFAERGSGLKSRAIRSLAYFS
jgi:hypothetical protein